MSTCEWEAVKSTIIDLYQNRGLGLKAVQKCMQQQYEFNASEQSYKRRLKIWNVRKNYSLNEKLTLLSDNANTGLEQVRLEGTPLKPQRLLRPVQRKGQRFKLTRRSGQSGVPRVRLFCAFESQSTERVLYYTKQYYQGYLERRPLNSVGVHHWSIGESFNMLRSAICKISTNQSAAFTMLDQVCASATATLQSQPLQALVLFGAYLSMQQWANHAPVRSAMVGHFTAIAAEIMGSNHHIPEMLKFMKDVQISDAVGSRVLDLTADVVRANLMQCPPDFVEFLVDLKVLHYETGRRPRTDLNFLDRKVHQKGDLRDSVRIKYALGYLRYWEDRLTEAKFWLSEVEKSVKNHEEHFWRHQRAAVWVLGRVYEKQGSLRQAAQFYALGIQRSVTVHADPDRYDHIVSRNFLEYLYNFHVRHGDQTAAAELWRQFGSMKDHG